MQEVAAMNLLFLSERTHALFIDALDSARITAAAHTPATPVRTTEQAEPPSIEKAHRAAKRAGSAELSVLRRKVPFRCLDSAFTS